MLKSAISLLVEGNDLSVNHAREVMQLIMEGKSTNAQLASFLTALRMKGESIEEITAFATVMREKCQVIETSYDVLDIVGTGGDKSNTFNISTISSFIVSAAGIPVAKHGNRSVSSKCGSADVLEALGVKIDLPANKSKEILDSIGLCFMFAPIYHTSMKHVAEVRKELGFRTIFNLLGPLSNPANAKTQLLGVCDKNLVEPFASVLMGLGLKRALVVHGHDGLDEVSLAAPSTIAKVKDGDIKISTLDPTELGFSPCNKEDLVGGDANTNADIALRILNGEKGPKRDIVVLNSAVCLNLSYDNASMKECIKMAETLIDSKKALNQLNQFIHLSNK